MEKKRITQAVFLTGAAARISQEVALLDKLIVDQGLKLSEQNTLLAGFSSGSLNIAAINMAFCDDSPIDWKEDYQKNTLFSLTNDDVFKKQKDGKISIFDTRPLRKTLNKFLSLKDIKAYGDLPFQSYVLTYSYRHLATTEWARNFGKDDNSNLKASDLFMASTAIPVVFPDQKIRKAVKKGSRNFPKGKFADGGTHGTFDNFEVEMGLFIKDNGAILDDLYIVSPMRKEDDSDDLLEIENSLVDKMEGVVKSALGKVLSNMSFRGFMKFLKALQQYQLDNKIAKQVYVSIPFLDKNTGILDFNVEEEAYDKVTAWTKNNDYCIDLDAFIKKYDK